MYVDFLLPRFNNGEKTLKPGLIFLLLSGYQACVVWITKRVVVLNYSSLAKSRVESNAVVKHE